MATHSGLMRGIMLLLTSTWLSFLACCTAGADRLPEKAPEAKANFDPQALLSHKARDAAALIDRMCEEAQRLNDYSVTFETRIFKKNGTVVEAGNLYFKKPRMMRIEELGDFHKGSVAVIGRDGMARAHGGGLASFVTLTMSPDNKMLNAANGDRMEDSDFVSLATGLKHRVKRGNGARVSDAPLVVEGMDEPVYLLELFSPGAPGTALKRVFVHPKTMLPVRWDDYDYKEPCLSTWRNLKTNVGLRDDLFKL